MALNLGSPCLPCLTYRSNFFSKLATFHINRSTLLFFFVDNNNNCSPLSSSPLHKPSIRPQASSTEGGNAGTTSADVKDESASVEVFDEELISRVSCAKDADEVLLMVAEKSEKKGGLVSVSDCCRVIDAALGRSNSDLALSVFNAMRSSFDQGYVDNGTDVVRWKWSRPDVSTFTSMVLGLAASLRVSDALKVIADICRVRVSPAEEVPFGKIVRCPTCLIAVAVAQPQHGTQVACCSKCRYQYELVSGDIIAIQSEEISVDVPAWRRGLKFLQIWKQSIPAATHSIVIQTPSGMARTYKFATETVDLPAQQQERVTIALAAPSDLCKQVGPFKLTPKSPKYYPGEPLCLTNHRDGRESLLTRAPSSNGSVSGINPSIFFPLLAVLATGDAASGIIDPRLPQLLSVVAVATLAGGATLNTMVLPQLSQLPQRLVDAVAIKQQLLAQYDTLQSRIKDLKEAAEHEVWMLARMCQLENKIFAVGEPSYRTRRSRIKRVCEGLENSLRGRIELIDSFARISSMIEIEVEMDTDVPAAEAASNVESIAKQIQQIMELENLEERWRLQAEANDEVERLLRTESLSNEQV